MFAPDRNRPGPGRTDLQEEEVPKTIEDYRRIGAAQTEHRRIADEVFLETNRQLLKWGVQDHHMGTGPKVRLLARTDTNLDLRYGEELEHIFRAETEARFKRGEGTYWDVLLEEVFEAGAAATPEELETELVQVAAVCASMVAASRRARGA